MKFGFLLLLCWLKAYSETQVYEGLARHEGQLVFAERHTLLLDNGTLISSFTEYLDPEGKKLGYLKSDYSQSLSAPTFTFLDDRQKISQGLKRVDRRLEAFSQIQDKHQSRIISRESKKPLVAAPGLIYFVAQNMENIIAHGGIEIDYIVPGKFEIYDFFIKPLKHGPEKAEFEIRLNSWWMRIFSPRLKLTYDVPNRRIISYEGFAGLRDTDGDMMSVDIQYDYDL
jgi:hypothetical protein